MTINAACGLQHGPLWALSATPAVLLRTCSFTLGNRCTVPEDVTVARPISWCLEVPLLHVFQQRHLAAVPLCQARPISLQLRRLQLDHLLANPPGKARDDKFCHLKTEMRSLDIKGLA